MRRHADKIAYFLIALAVYLIVLSFSLYKTAPLVNTLLYVSAAMSLLAGNIPKVVELPLHYAHPVKCIEYFMFFLAILCFITLLLRHTPLWG